MNTLIEPYIRIPRNWSSLLKKKNLVLLILFGFVFSYGLSSKLQTKYGCQKCNVILFVADTLSARHMSLYGYDRRTTPFIDQYFGTGAIVFKDTSSTAPWTFPSFASFLTSQFPNEINVGTLYDRLSGNIPNLVTSLRAEDIDLAFFPQGIFQIKEASSSAEKVNFRQFGIVEQFKDSEIIRTKGHQQLFQDALSWIGHRPASSSRPFFIMMQSLIAHAPYDPPESYRRLFGGPEIYPGAVTNDDIDQSKSGILNKVELDRYKLQYDQSIRYLDDSLKDFIERIPEDIKANTVVIFISDHGEAFGEHGDVEHASSVYQEQISVPLLIKFPNNANRVVGQPVSLIDLSPTILELFNIPAPQSFKGASLLSLVNGRSITPRVIRAELSSDATLGRGEVAKGKGNPTQVHINGGQLEEVSARLGVWKLIRRADSGLELYNLAKDPWELTNIMSQLPRLSKSVQLIISQLAENLKVKLPS